MDGVYPSFLMPVFPAQYGDWNPGVHEDRIDEPVKINLERYFYLKEYDERYDGLDEAQDCPELMGYQYIIIENHGETWIEHIDVGHDQIESGKKEEIVLQELHDSIKDHDTVSPDAFFQQDGDISFRAVELSLCPSFSLAAGCHESQRFFIIDDRIVTQQVRMP